MNRPPTGLRLATAMAHAALWCYPPGFRRRHTAEFVEVVKDRWRREFTGSRSAVRATLRVSLTLCADTFFASPRAWRSRPDAEGDRAGLATRVRRGFGGLGGDMRLSVRALRRQPGIAALVIGTLGLGLGLGAATFDALDRVVLRPIPAPNGDRLVHVALRQPQRGWQFAPPIDLVDRWRQGARTITRIEVYQSAIVVGRGPAGARMTAVIAMSPGLPSMLGARPLAGRLLGPADAAPGAPPAAMMTESHWRTAYGGAPSVVGETVRLGESMAVIVGIWPDALRFAYQGMPEFLTIAQPAPSTGSWTVVLAERALHATNADVERELAPFLAEQDGLPPDVVPALLPAYGFIATAYVTGLWLVFAAGVTLMIVAIVNAANVLLGRASARAGELGIRRAVGGSLTRLLRLFLLESAVLTTAGLVLAVAVAVAAGRLVAAYGPEGLPLDPRAWPAWRVLALAGAGAFAACFLSAALPTLRLRSVDVRAVLAGASGGRSLDESSRLRQALVLLQAAMAVLLAVGAALMLRSFGNLNTVDPGVDVDHLAMVHVRAPQAAIAKSPEAVAAFQSGVRDAFASIPGVDRMTTASNELFKASLSGGAPYLDGEAAPEFSVRTFATWQNAPAGFFATLGIPIVAGRDFSSADRAGTVIVNESFARSRGGQVVGRRLRLSAEGPGLEIVGVAGDTKSSRLTDEVDRVQIYSPGDGLGNYVWYVFRTSTSPDAILPLARQKLAAIDPDLPMLKAATGRELFRGQTAQHRFVAWLLGTLAALGVLFAVTGIYGVVSLDVGRRTREVGLRMALGASTARVGREVMGRALRPLVAGAALGVLGALWVGPFLEALLFNVPARDVWSAAGGVVLVAAAGSAASWLPARRASRVDPASTLRA